MAANRDEVAARSAVPLSRWTSAEFAEAFGGVAGDVPVALDSPSAPVVAGRDATAGGTWLGVRAGGRLAAVTNVRTPDLGRGPVSRGRLPLLGLADAMPDDLSVFGPANVLWGDPDELRWASNRGRAADDPAGAPGDVGPALVGEGIHVLSNASLDTPWPKAQRAAAGVARVLENWEGPGGGPEATAGSGSSPAPDATAGSDSGAASGSRPGSVAGSAPGAAPDWAVRLLAPLLSRDRAPLADLPRTGVPLVPEWFLSSPFVRMPGYGTRCQTAVAAAEDGTVYVVERTFGSDGRVVRVDGDVVPAS